MKSRVPQFIATTAAYLLVGVLGLQLAWWGWHFFAPPHSVAPVSATNASNDDLSLARRLFGNETTATVEPANTASEIRLKGVFAVEGKTLSAAVVNLGAKDQVVHQGEEISKGIKLTEVNADHIIISRNGVREQIALARYQPGAVARTPVAASSGFRLNVASNSPNGYSLSRQELNTILQDPRQMDFLGRIGVAPGGGVRIDDAGGNTLAGKLGLKAGDIIASVNGQPVNSAGDLARLYSQFNTTASVRVEVKRAGSPTMLNYAIQN